MRGQQKEWPLLFHSGGAPQGDRVEINLLWGPLIPNSYRYAITQKIARARRGIRHGALERFFRHAVTFDMICYGN